MEQRTLQVTTIPLLMYSTILYSIILKYLESISSGSTRKIQRTADPSDCNDHQNCQPNTSGKRQNPDNDEYHFNNIWAPPNKR